MEPRLTARSQEVHRFISGFLKEKHRYPTYAEIASARRCSLSTVHRHVIALARMGLVAVQPKVGMRSL